MKRALAFVIVIAACRSSAPAQEPIENRGGKPTTLREPSAARFDWPRDDDDLTPASGSTSSPSPTTPPPPAPACEARAQKARDYIQNGQNAAAHVEADMAYACQPHPSFVPLAFMTACTSGNANNAKRYYALLTPDEQARFAQLCIRQNPPVAYQ